MSQSDFMPLPLAGGGYPAAPSRGASNLAEDIREARLASDRLGRAVAKLQQIVGRRGFAGNLPAVAPSEPDFMPLPGPGSPASADNAGAAPAEPDFMPVHT